MENNDLITIAAIKERKELISDMDENLEPPSECCVYRVPKDLRKVNEEAYTPQVVSIGPLHHGKKELADMEKQKIRYQREFNGRLTTNAWQEFINFIEKDEKRICNCYAEMPKLEKLDFITMILYDAVFIIEFFLRVHHEHKHQNDFLIKQSRVRYVVLLDFLLLENQLPYFVIKKLYMLAFPNRSHGYPPFFELAFASFPNMFCSRNPEEKDVKHFTDLARHAMTKKYPNPRPEGQWITVQESKVLCIDLPGSVKLQESGVKFKNFKEGECLLDLRFEKKNLLIPWFEVSELQIPPFLVDDGTECIIRNVMALEQCHYPEETHVCNYINLMDDLINTEEDVNFLAEMGILSNCVGDNARIANMVNKLCLRIRLSDSCYKDIVRDLKEHYDTRWNHVKATLKRVYFSNL